MSRSAISSLQNPQVKNVVKLRDRRQRDRQGLMIIEGYRELTRAVEAELPLETLYYCEDWYQGTNEAALVEAIKELGASLVEVSRAVFKKMAYRDRPEGLLALVPIPQRDFEAFQAWWEGLEESERQAAFLVVVEAIEKPGNLGTMLRSADAAGASAVLVCDRVTDMFNPNVVRASLGTLFCLPVFQVSSEDLLKWLDELKIPSFAATPTAEKLYSNVALKPPSALVIGSEQYGLSDLWMKGATESIRIPMRGRADSLNAAQAATLLMFEVVRQIGE